MISFFGGSQLFRKIMLSILLASIFFLSLLTAVVYYSNEILEDDLLAKQTEFELKNIQDLLELDVDAPLPNSANLRIYLRSRENQHPIPEYLDKLNDGVHHDIKVGDKAYHVMVAAHSSDKIYIQYDITEIERSEGLLHFILQMAWVVLIVMVFFIARLLSKKLSDPIAKLNHALSTITADQRGVQLADRFEDDEMGQIARAFDTYTRKMDDYVEKQIAFAAMASHELRSPLTIVQTSADLIASCQDDPAIKPHLEKIQRASSNMANMIHALLAVTRDQQTENAIADVELQPLVDEIIETLKVEASLKQILLENHLEKGLILNTDRTLLTVVITNLIRNSVKHSQKSKIEITMETSVLNILDNGIGITTNDLKHLFDFGYRGQTSSGYGVGLYISKLICDHQRWGLDLQPNPDGGTIARIKFPDKNY